VDLLLTSADPWLSSGVLDTFDKRSHKSLASVRSDKPLLRELRSVAVVTVSVIGCSVLCVSDKADTLTLTFSDA